MLHFITISRWLAGTVLLVALLAAGLLASEKAPKTAVPARTVIKVSFLVDRRVSQGMYMGDHWISPATYIRVGERKTVIVPARAFIIDADAQKTKIAPRWKSSNPGVAQVSAAHGHQVELTILKAGQSDLTVTHGQTSKKLVVKATPLDGTMRVEISQ